MRSLTIRTLLAMAAVASLHIASPVQAAGRGAAPVEEESDEGENFLDLPGIGPIPMPPGVRVFGPGQAPNRAGKPAPPKSALPQPDKSAPPKDIATSRREALDALFTRLAEASDEAEAQSIAGAILRHWARSGSDTGDLLTARAAAAQAAGDNALARDLLDYVTALQPYWAEGFVRRARARAALGDDKGALMDLEQAVRIDPKRFDAFAALGALAETLGEKKRGLEAYRRSLQLDPQQDSLRKSEERLKLEVEGRDI